jgi:type VI secretion system protein ImpC
LGFIPLVHLKGTDSAAFFNVNSIQMPRQYDSPEATANARLITQLPYIFAISRFAQYMKCMLRDKIGSFMTRRDLERFLSTWISNYVLDKDGASQQEKAQRPLRSASIQVDTPDDNPSSPRVIAFLQPHFQLDELTVSLRLEVDLPFPAK